MEREGACLIVDGQKVCPAPVMKFKGEGDAKTYDSVPLGYELKAEVRRRADGTLARAERWRRSRTAPG